MSLTITQAMVDQWSANIHMLAQQKESRLRGAVMEETVTGEYFSYDRLGDSAAQAVTNRHGDTPLMNPEHSRRWAGVTDYEWATLIDNPDKAKLLVDPTSEYVMTAVAALNRAIDDEIIAAFDATVTVGKLSSASGTAAFDSANMEVVVASSGLTISKLIAAAKKLGQNEVEKEDRFIAVTEEQLEDLLGTTQVTSADYNTVKALKQGDIDTFMGFKFIHTERLGLDDNGDRKVFAWQKRGMVLGINHDIATSIDKRPDKRNATQPYAMLGCGALRTEETRVVRILCQE